MEGQVERGFRSLSTVIDGRAEDHRVGRVHYRCRKGVTASALVVQGLSVLLSKRTTRAVKSKRASVEGVHQGSITRDVVGFASHWQVTRRGSFTHFFLVTWSILHQTALAIVLSELKSRETKLLVVLCSRLDWNVCQ